MNKSKRKTFSPTCVTMAASAGLLFSLTALVFGLSMAFRLQRRNGPPQRLGLRVGGRTVLFLDIC